MTKVFHFAWLTKAGNRTWKVCQTCQTCRPGNKTPLSWILSDWTGVINSFAICASVEMLWLCIDKSRLQGIPLSFYGHYPKNSLSWDSSISIWNMVSYDFLLYMLKIKLKPRPEEQIPCHSSISNGIICGPHWGSCAVRDHLRSNLGIISSLGIVCGRGSFAALCSAN